ncbi:MAG: glycosyltransferase family 4 protein [Planctomycetota bacterium]
MWVLVSSVGAFIVTLAVTPLVMRLARRLGAIDKPQPDKVHVNPTPRLGGFAILAGVGVGALAVGWSSELTFSTPLIACLGAAIAMSLVGAADDCRNWSARTKFLLQLPVAIAVVMLGVSFTRFEIPGILYLDLGSIGPVVTVFWLVGVTNAFNLIDGLDGLATSLALIISVGLGLLFLLTGTIAPAVIAFSVAGSSFAFLFYNSSPARVFLGDTGSLMLGMLLGSLVVLATHLPYLPGGSLSVAIAFFIYPVADTLVVIARRQLYGKPIFNGDHGHIHHLLLDFGIGHRGATWLLMLATAAGIVVASSLSARTHLLTIIVLMVLCTAAGFGLRSIGFFAPFLPTTIRHRRAQFGCIYHLGGLLRSRLALSLDREAVIDHVIDGIRGFGVIECVMQIRGGDRLTVRLTEPPPEGSPRLNVTIGSHNLTLAAVLDADAPADLLYEYRYQLSRLVLAADAQLTALDRTAVVDTVADGKAGQGSKGRSASGSGSHDAHERPLPASASSGRLKAVVEIDVAARGHDAPSGRHVWYSSRDTSIRDRGKI